MKGFLSRIIDRQLRRLTVGAMVGVAIIATSAVAATRVHVPAFDQAELAVEKAQTLLNAGVCGAPSEKAKAACDRMMRKAHDLLEKALDAISAAAVAADGGDVVLRR